MAPGEFDWSGLAQESVIVCDASGCIRAWNAAAEQLYGWTAEQMLGRRLDDWFGADAQAAAPWQGELLRTTATGAAVWVQVRRGAMASRCGATMLIEFGIDITATRADAQSEAFYRDMFSGTAVATWHLDARRARAYYRELKAGGVTDIVGYAKEHPAFIDLACSLLSVVDVNDTTVRLFGASDRSELIGATVAPFWMPGRFDVFMGSVEASFNDLPSFRGETPMRTLDGRQIEVVFTVAASAQLRAIGQALVCIVDVTDRVRAQQSLLDMQASYAHADRVASLGELASSIAHEVNQPLAAIITAGGAGLRWLNRAQPDLAEARQLMASMIADAKRASDIIGRVRAMAAPQASVQSLLALNALVSDALLFVRPEVQKRGIAETLLLADALPPLTGDHIQLQQVLVNLVMNACHALEGRPSPGLAIRTGMDGPAWLLLEVCDSGAGIAAADLARLFDPFFTTRKQGMGIGLSICRSIIEAHGGTITAANADGGACFTIRLPACPAGANGECQPRW
jgi:PAS domain S-box-containing protein